MTNEAINKLNEMIDQLAFQTEKNKIDSNLEGIKQTKAQLNTLLTLPQKAISQYQNKLENDIAKDYSKRLNDVLEFTHRTDAPFPITDSDLEQGVKTVREKLLQDYKVDNPSNALNQSLEMIEKNMHNRHLIRRQELIGKHASTNIKKLYNSIGDNAYIANDAQIKNIINEFTPQTNELLGQNNTEILFLNARAKANDELIKQYPNSISLNPESFINQDRQNIQNDLNKHILFDVSNALKSSTNLNLDLQKMNLENPAYANIIYKYRNLSDDEIKNKIDLISRENANSIEPQLAENFIRQRSNLLYKNVIDYAEATNLMKVQNIFTSSSNTLEEEFEQSLLNSSMLLSQFGTTNILDSKNINALASTQVPLDLKFTIVSAMREKYKNFITLHPESNLTIGMFNRDVESINPDLNTYIQLSNADQRFSISKIQQLENMKEKYSQQINSSFKNYIDNNRSLFMFANKNMFDSIQFMIADDLRKNYLKNDYRSFTSSDYFKIVNNNFIVPIDTVKKLEQRNLHLSDIRKYIINNFVLSKERNAVKIVNTGLNTYRVIYNNGNNYISPRNVPIEFDLNDIIDSMYNYKHNKR